MALLEPYVGTFGPPLEFGPDTSEFWNPAFFNPRYYKVLPKEGGALQRFNLWGPQQILAAAVVYCMENNKRLAHVKPRKEGSSTFFSYEATKHVCFRRGCQGLIISQSDKITDQLARAAVRAYNSLPEWMRPVRRERVERSIDLPGQDSLLSLATAGSKDPARGFTGLQFLLATEVSSWESADTWTAVLSNLPQRGAFVVAESTPLHHGDQLQRIWKEADEADSPWFKVFTPWTMMNEYAMTPPRGWVPNEIVRDYSDKHGINERQAYWMQAWGIPNCSNKMEKFRAEYPIDDMDCWRELGSAVFNYDRLHERLIELGVNGIQEAQGDTRLYLEPVEKHRYVIACDPASSFSKRDYFGIVCLDLQTCEQVFDSQMHGDAHQIARSLVLWAKKYNNAEIVVEANGVGDGLLSALVHLGYKRIYYRGKGSEKKPGWWSDQRRKVEAYTITQELLEDNSVCINSHRLLRQMQESLGPMEKRARDEEGGHFDLVTAFCMACWYYRFCGVSSYQARKTDATELAAKAWNKFMRKIGHGDNTDATHRYGTPVLPWRK